MSIGEEIDIKAVMSKLGVEKMAIQKGRDNLPAQTDDDLDAPQNIILQYMKQRCWQARQAVVDMLEHHRERRDAIELEMDVTHCRGVTAKAKQSINRVLQDRKRHLIETRRYERKMYRELQAFVAVNDLHREPSYPDSNIWHWAIVVIAIVLESLANSYFFSKGSDLGLLGGVLQALLISLANIGTALFNGIYVVRQTYHVSRLRKWVGYVVSFIYMVLVILFNLAVAHYRAELEADPITAIVQAIPKLLANPLGISNLDAWLLFVIGVLFASFAVIKALRSDDVYPGYGKVHRNHSEALEAYETEKQEFRDKINGVIDEQFNELRAIVYRTHQNTKEYNRLIERTSSVVAEYERYAKQVEDILNTMLSQYRDTNVRVRSGAAPGYFQDQVHFGPELKLPECDLGDERDKSQKFEQLVVSIDNDSERIRIELHELNEEKLNSLDDFFSTTEDEVELQLQSERM